MHHGAPASGERWVIGCVGDIDGANPSVPPIAFRPMTPMVPMLGLWSSASRRWIGYRWTKLVRVPWNEPGIVGKVLDGGAYGVICPMVNTRGEAQALVSYCRYPPKGQRSNGPIRAAMYGVAGEYQKTANDEILVIPMIETRQAVENIDDILYVRGIDAIYVGPADLAFSLGKTPKLDSEDSEQLGM